MEGEAITFLLPSEDYHLEKIQKIIRSIIPVEEIPATVKIEETPYEEQQQMLKELDNQRKKEDPTFQGAFHEKSEKNQRILKMKIEASEKKKALREKRNAGKPKAQKGKNTNKKY
jgi:ATP-dependent RNA helicase RhlE